ncbi:hypothetical protein LXL04_007392 [Taraxacum kok-saghyz]
MPPKEERYDNADNPIATLHAHMLHVAQISTDTNTKLDRLIELLTLREQPPPPPPPPPGNNQPRPPKILLPNFDGSNPLDWLFQANNYFEYYNIPNDQRVALSVFYCTGQPFQAYTNINGAAYQTEFERLGNQVDGLTPVAIRNCFISDLCNDIQNEMSLHKPTNLYQTYGLAKLIEEKLAATKPRYTTPRSYSTPFSHPSSTTSDSPAKPTTTTPLLSTPPPTPNLPFTRLSPDALQKRRVEGLCFRCPAKYSPGHKCSPPQFMVIVDNEDETPPDTSLIETDAALTVEPPDQFLALSTTAFYGLASPQALHVTGFINNKPVKILVDSGSTHNIIQPRIVANLKLEHDAIPSFPVMVGSGDYLHCNGFCRDLEIHLKKTPFKLPFFILPVAGADVVLGLAWLSSLGPIKADSSIPEITFQHGPNTITLTGEPISTAASSTDIQSLINQKSIASLHALYFHFQPHQPPNDPPQIPHKDTTISKLLHTYGDIFAVPTSLPPTRTQDHRIPTLRNAAPVNVKPYRYPHYQKQIMTTLITEMLNDGIIKPSTSPFSSPVLLVRKKDGTWRFCVDYRALNATTVKDRFSIPTVDELLDELHDTTMFSKIDLRAGYHQICVDPEDTHKTDFRTVDGHYEFLVMPFGLTNTPSTFQATMNELFRDVLRRYVLVFFDDILVYSTSVAHDYHHLEHVFQKLTTTQFKAKLAKCTFATNSIDYLGHVISAQGVQADLEKIDAIYCWPQPINFTTLRGFLGLAGYYRCFVPGYAIIAAGLSDFLRKPTFSWTPEAANSFQHLKKAMTQLITLTLPDFAHTFDVTTDASNIAVGAVLSQQDRPISFFSKRFCPRMQVASAYVRELFAITEAVKKWWQYLIGHKFRIFTDQRSLKHLLSQVVQTPEQYKWATKLLDYDFEIIYKRGKENTVADALSRVELPQLLSISATNPTWLTELQDFYNSTTCQTLIQQLLAKNSDNDTFQLRDGLLYKQHRLYIPMNLPLRRQLLNEYHASTLGGHSGVLPRIRRISATFLWPRLKIEVTQFIRQCDVCQQIKAPTHKPYGLLQPLPIPSSVWSDISMDFITHLPSSNGKTTIWVIVDRFSKYAHFIALPSQFGVMTLATLFMHHVYRLHGLPNSIVSDRDPIFLSSFWKEIFKLMGTKLRYSTASIKMPPFQALYGCPAPDLNRYEDENSTTVSIEATLQEQQCIRSLHKDNLNRAQQRMASLANSHRRDKEFAVGDLVYLRLQDYRQKSVQSRETKKLSKRFFGPFKVLERIGKVAYKLDLPQDSHNATATEPTWENYDEFRIRFPEFCVNNSYASQLEDELILKGGAVDTSLTVEDTSTTHSSPTMKTNRPKRVTKKPARLLD